MKQSIGYIVVEEGDSASFEEIIKHDPTKLAQSIADAETYAKSLGYSSYSVFEVSLFLVKKV